VGLHLQSRKKDFFLHSSETMKGTSGREFHIQCVSK
jgi:hypothetical protein